METNKRTKNIKYTVERRLIKNMGFDKDEFVAEEIVKETKNPKVESKDNKEVQKNKYLVVKELPTQPVRSSLDEETGITTTFVTIEEALTNLIGGDL